MNSMSLQEMIQQTAAGQTYLAWCRAHLRALHNDDALMVRHTYLMANRSYTDMQQELCRKGDA